MVSVYIHGIHTARGFKPPLSDSKFPRSPMGLTHGKEVVSPASPLTTRTPPPTGQARWETKYQEPRTCNKQRPVPYPQLPITDPRSPPAPRDPSAFSPQPRTAPCARKAVAPIGSPCWLSTLDLRRSTPHFRLLTALPPGSRAALSGPPTVVYRASSEMLGSGLQARPLLRSRYGWFDGTSSRKPCRPVGATTAS